MYVLSFIVHVIDPRQPLPVPNRFMLRKIANQPENTIREIPLGL
jgi:hypothetical protein